MISVEDARARILGTLVPLPAMRAPLSGAFSRHAAADIFSPIDLPLFDNSAMDGYTVRSEGLKKASAENPVVLRCSSRTAAGEKQPDSIAAGMCGRVFTGSTLPVGADAVVMQEDVTVNGERISFSEPIKPFENIRMRGEDIRAGAMLVAQGKKITATVVAALAATGHREILVHRPCKIAIVATGNELKEPGEALSPGQIYESNRSMIAALLDKLGAEVRCQPIVCDDLTATVAAFRSAFEGADLVISAGGVSVGEYDFVKEAFGRLGGTVDFWQVAMRPGKPFMFGQLGEKVLFGLPGNPVSAFVTFLALVRPAILRMQGAADCSMAALPGELAETVRNPGDRRHFVRVRWESGKVHVAGPQKSHMIGSLSSANALLDVPAGVQLERGSRVEVSVWDLPDGTCGACGAG